MVLSKAMISAGLLFAGMAIAAVSGAGLPEQSASVGTTTLTLEPAGGKMKLSPKENTDNRFMACTMWELSELDVFGKVTNNTIALVEEQEAGWSKIKMTTVDTAGTIDGLYSGYSTGMVLSRVTFTIANRVIMPTAKVPVEFSNGQKMVVPAMGLKFWIEISNWPFIDTEQNSLRLGLRLSAGLNGLTPSSIKVIEGLGGNSSKIWRVAYKNGTKPFGFADFPTFVNIQNKSDTGTKDGVARDVTISVADQKGSGYDVLIASSAFDPKTEKLVYHPQMYLYPADAKAEDIPEDPEAEPTTAKEKQKAESAASSMTVSAALLVLLGSVVSSLLNV